MKLTNKKCGKCGKPYAEVPVDAKKVGGLFWWECDVKGCNSTLTSLTKEAARELGIKQIKKG